MRLGALLTHLFFGVLSIGLTTFDTEAAGTRKKPRVCTVTGIVPLGRYVVRNEAQCFRNNSQLRSAAVRSFSSRNTKLELASSSRVRSLKRVRNEGRSYCRYIGVAATETFFKESATRCLSTVRKAEKRGFRKLVISTSSTPTTVTTVTTRVSSGQPTTTTTTPTTTTTTTSTTLDMSLPSMSFSVTLTPNEPDFTYTGSCSALLNQGHATLSLDCTHNAPDPTEFHLHVIPSNDSFCERASPGNNIVIDCTLTEQQRQGVLAGMALVAVHFGTPGTRTGLDGYIR